MSNRAAGGLALFASLALFALYTFWAIVLPLFPDDLAVHAYVPDRRWAVTAPSLVLAVGIGSVGLYIAALLRADALHDLQAQREAAQAQSK